MKMEPITFLYIPIVFIAFGHILPIAKFRKRRFKICRHKLQPPGEGGIFVKIPKLIFYTLPVG